MNRSSPISADTWRFLPASSPLPAFHHGVRRRYVTPAGCPIWTETLPGGHAFNVSAFGHSKPALTGMQTQVHLHVMLQDFDGNEHTFVIQPPLAGACAIAPRAVSLAPSSPAQRVADGHSGLGPIDWSVVWQWRWQESALSPPDVWRAWLLDITQRVWSELGVEWVGIALVPGLPTQVAQCLAIETAPGAVWFVQGAERAIAVLQRALRVHPCDARWSPRALDHTPARRLHRLGALAVRLQFELGMPALSPAQQQQLQTGCLLFAHRGAVPAAITQSLHWPVLAVSESLSRTHPIHLRAALDLFVRIGAHTDTFELQWNTVMTPEHDTPRTRTEPLPETGDAPTTVEALQAQLHCVIGTQDFSLSDLLNLQPGDLLPLHAFPLPHVALFMGTQRMGTGELVRCGQTLAVQIVDWLPESEAGAA